MTTPETLAEVTAERDRLREVVRMADADRDFYTQMAAANAVCAKARDDFDENDPKSRRRLIAALDARARLESSDDSRRLRGRTVREIASHQFRLLNLLEKRIGEADGQVAKLQAEREKLRASVKALKAENRKLARKVRV